VLEISALVYPIIRFGSANHGFRRIFSENDNVVDVSEFKHYRINHSKLFANKHNHINGIENFWNQAKRHMRKFNGAPKDHFHLFLKECEWRFNNSDPKLQLKQLHQWVKDELG